MKAKYPVLQLLLLSVITAGGVRLLVSNIALQAQDATQPAATRRIGAIKAINGTAITLTPDSGPEVSVTVQGGAHIVKIPPGEKTLKNATPVALQDLQVGDRILVGGKAAADGSITASSIVVMKRTDVEAHQDQERQDWQKRGMGGMVSAVDPAAGTVSISTSGLGGKKTITVRASKSTLVRRYAPDSARFEDAKTSSLQEIHVGDQLRARGERGADGAELLAEEIVTGNFPNIAGVVKSIDATAGTVSVQDLSTKKTLELKITPDSQLHKIPAEMAQRFAMRLKAAKPGASPGEAQNSSPNSPPASGANGESTSNGSPSASTGQGGGMRAGGGFDLQRMLDQTPKAALADLHKGDAVAVLTTEGTPSGGSTVIKMYSGVEPILEAPNGSQAMMLAPWSLGGAPTGDANQ